MVEKAYLWWVLKLRFEVWWNHYLPVGAAVLSCGWLHLGSLKKKQKTNSYLCFTPIYSDVISVGYGNFLKSSPGGSNLQLSIAKFSTQGTH